MTAPRPGRFGSTAGRRAGLALRLFLSDLLVIAAGAGTLLAVSVLVAPALFHEHLRRAHLPDLEAGVRDHVDAAFDRALTVSMLIAVVVATVAAGAISALVARRLAAPVCDVTEAAQHLADGHYETVVPDPALGPEFTSLARSMNRLSHRLATTEADRRRLTADLAHQLRTPLASLRATVEAVADGVLAPDAETLAVLADQTERLHRLVGDLEKVSRAEERRIVLHPEAQPLEPVARRCVVAVRDRFQAADVALTLDVDPRTPVARIDPDRIVEALTNLLDNALRHTPAGGSVAVTLCPGPAGGAELVVRDTGEGFDPEVADRLFRRFHRGTGADPGSGSGLGLTIARALVEAHGGTLEARSDGPGRGATFAISLPGE